MLTVITCPATLNEELILQMISITIIDLASGQQRKLLPESTVMPHVKGKAARGESARIDKRIRV